MLHIVYGTRAELIKFSSLIRELQKRKVPFKLIDTGGHDTKSIREQLKLPNPDYYFGKSWRDKWSKLSMPLAALLTLVWGTKVFFKLMKIFSREGRVIIYHGNTKEVPLTVFAARSLFWRKFILVHYESGLRGNTRESSTFDFFSKIGDHYADILFVPTKSCEKNLKKEHIHGKIIFTGSVMREVVEQTMHNVATPRSKPLVFVSSSRSIHNKKDSEEFVKTINRLPFHSLVILNPRMKWNLEKFDLLKNISKDKVSMKDGLMYKEVLRSIHDSSFVITDSEGMQEECAILGKRCIITNDFIQFPELLENKIAVVTGWNSGKILQAAKLFISKRQKTKLPYFYDGKATSQAVNALEKLA